MNKPSLSGNKRPDITPHQSSRDQARLFQMGKYAARPRWWQVIAVVFVFIIFIVLTAFIFIKVLWATPSLDSSKVQAVFLDDGKVFFGTLKNTDGSYLILKNAYYSQTATSDGKSNSVSQTALIKVGSESYGPESDLQIARSHVLFWQNLRDDSQITISIKQKTAAQ